MLTNINNWQVAPSLAWNEQFACWLKNTPTQKRTERSALTLDAYLRDVKLFAQWFETVNGCAFSPELLNAIDLKAYFGVMEEDGKAATHNRKLASIKMLIRWAQGEGILDGDPCEWIPQMDAMRESPRDIPDEEWASLEHVAETGAHLREESELYRLRDLLIFRLMGNAGLRIHEAVGLRLDDLHLEQGYIHVLGKGKKHRKIKVKAGTLVETIRAWMAIMPKSIDGTLVTDAGGRSIDRCTAWRRFGLIAKTAGVQATPHALRHTFIYRYLKNFIRGDFSRMMPAIKAVCQLTGDTTDVILAYYTNPRESDIYAAMEAM